LASVFHSKVDVWLIVLTVAIPVLVLGIVILGDGSADGRVAELLAVAICAVVMIFCAWLYFSTRYTVTAEALLVKSGPFSWVVPLREISSIEPTRNPLSSPALSLDRLRVRYGEREIMISPADKAGFIAAIEKQREAIGRLN
jgi:hypothetical protein